MHTLVLDIGKTHVKLHVLNDERGSVHSCEITNRVIHEDPYPHFDTDHIWQWLLDGIREAAKYFSISAISVTTHGATAALVDRTDAEAGLVLPVLDYEFSEVENCSKQYNNFRPSFLETYSPDLPAGLNLGRQLFWQQRQYPEAFARVTDILMYPQYWTWRLTGKLCSEVTSLGCHTDLWAPEKKQFSSLVESQNWIARFPEVVPAWTSLGAVKPAIRKHTGLNENCRVYAGIHDSNASFLRYKTLCGDKPFTVISTGTWSIVMASGVALHQLQANRDTLANVDVTGQPVVCSRSMGGREFEIIRDSTGAAGDGPPSEKILQTIIDQEVMALPDFSGGSGPLAQKPGAIIGNPPKHSATSLASLYCALMLDYQMDLIKAEGDIFIEGAFLKNPLLCSVLAQLRTGRKIFLSSDSTGTVQGCAQLSRWNEPRRPPALVSCSTGRLRDLDAYKNLWRNRAEGG